MDDFYSIKVNVRWFIGIKKIFKLLAFDYKMLKYAYNLFIFYLFLKKKLKNFVKILGLFIHKGMSFQFVCVTTQ